MHLRETAQAIVMLACVACAVPSTSEAQRPYLSPPPIGHQDPFTTVGGWLELQFVEGSTELSDESKQVLDELKRLTRDGLKVRFNRVLLHSSMEEVISGLPEAVRDKERMKLLKGLTLETLGTNQLIRMAPLQPLGETRSWTDGRIRTRWVGFCNREISRQQCEQIFSKLLNAEVPAR